MKKTRLLSLFALIIVGCAGNNFRPGTIDYTKKDPFKKELYLKGKLLQTDEEITKLRDVRMVYDNDRLLVTSWANPIQVFEVNDEVKLIKTFDSETEEAPYGNPIYISQSLSDSMFSYAIGAGNGDVYRIEENLSISKTSEKLYDNNIIYYNNLGTVSLIKDFYRGADKEWYFVSPTRDNEKFIYKTINGADSLSMTQVLRLDFDTTVNFHHVFNGSFTFNQDKKRAVYAYRHYPRIVFLDTETDRSSTLLFSGDGFDMETLQFADVGDINIIYSLSICATENYVYALYYGKKWKDIVNAGISNRAQAFILQFDWNGNPIRRMKLSDYGLSFCISEDDKHILLYSTSHDFPITKFDIPKL